MYLAAKGKELSQEDMKRIINSFLTNERAEFTKRYDYYLGKQKILQKLPSDTGKPCNRIVCNFVENIVSTYEGYALGIPVTYQSNVNIETLMDVLRYNDVVDEDSEYLRKGLIFGRAPEICYLDEEAKVRFKTLDPREVIPVYENTLNGDLLYAIRIWEETLSDGKTPNYYCQVYDDRVVRTYETTNMYTSFTLIDEQQHYFNQVPVTFFSLNTEERGIADSIFSLQDAYNALVSDSIDDWDSFCDAYLVLKGMTADAEDLNDMKQKRALILDSDASAEYLIKNTQTTEIEHLLATVEEKIRELSSCPNFNNETFGTSSGIAIRYRMMAMENRTAAILNNFRKALQRRIELLADVESLISGEQVWRDIQIEFTRNLPTDLSDTVTAINQLRGLVSEETLLAQLPFIDNVEAELERISKERASMVQMYAGGFEVNEDGQ